MTGLRLSLRAFATLALLGVVIALVAIQLLKPAQNQESTASRIAVSSPMAGTTAAFTYLSTHGNSSCSLAFQQSIASLPDDARLQGSCCAPMNADRYRQQVEGLRAYSLIPEVPPDPYNIEAGLAKRLMRDYDLSLTPQQQAVYDYAMAHSREHGPCCCQCWRWQTYGGLGKYLITQDNFTGEQVTAVWDLPDGCGGRSDAG